VAITTARIGPWLRRDSERPIDSSDDALPSGAVDPVASSAAVDFLRDVRKSRDGQRHNGSSRLLGFEFLARHSSSRLASSVRPGSSVSSSETGDVPCLVSVFRVDPLSDEHGVQKRGHVRYMTLWSSHSTDIDAYQQRQSTRPDTRVLRT